MATFHAFPGIAFKVFSPNFVGYEPCKRCSRAIFCILHKKTVLKDVSHHPNPKFSVWPYFDLVNLDDFDLKFAQYKLRMVLISVPDAVHAGLLAYFHLARYLRAKGKHDKSSNILIRTWPATPSVAPRLWILQIYRTPYVFLLNQTSSSQDRSGDGRK